MKVNKLFHWLYALLMFLPFAVFLVNFVGFGLSMSGFTELDSETVFGWFVYPTIDSGVINGVYGVYSYLVSDVFGWSADYLSKAICYLLTYWTLTSIIYLIFDIVMYVPLLVHRWIDKATIC